jgi:hypothetical protein
LETDDLVLLASKRKTGNTRNTYEDASSTSHSSYSFYNRLENKRVGNGNQPKQAAQYSEWEATKRETFYGLRPTAPRKTATTNIVGAHQNNKKQRQEKEPVKAK